MLKLHKGITRDQELCAGKTERYGSCAACYQDVTSLENTAIYCHEIGASKAGQAVVGSDTLLRKTFLAFTRDRIGERPLESVNVRLKAISAFQSICSSPATPRL